MASAARLQRTNRPHRSPRRLTRKLTCTRRPHGVTVVTDSAARQPTCRVRPTLSWDPGDSYVAQRVRRTTLDPQAWACLREHGPDTAATRAAMRKHMTLQAPAQWDNS